MTSKIQTLATVAVLAAITMSFGLTPAFAASVGTTTNTTADVVADEIADCGSNFMITRVTPQSSSDTVQVMTSGNDCPSFSSVTVSLYVEQVWQGTVSTTDSYKVFSFNTSGLTVGDDVYAVTTWYY